MPIARATSRSLRWARGSPLASWSARERIPMNSSTWSARSAASLRRGCWRKVPSITFSRMVSAGSGCTTWKVRPMPSRVAWYGSPPVMSCPAKRMFPDPASRSL